MVPISSTYSMYRLTYLKRQATIYNQFCVSELIYLAFPHLREFQNVATKDTY